jgi:Fe-S cluster assembly protein SufD
MAEIMMMKTAAEQRLAESFAALQRALPGDPKTREAAFRSFYEAGFPHRRVEAFKYTDLRAAIREAAPLPARPDPAEAEKALARPALLHGVEAAEIAFVSGHLVTGLHSGLPDGVDVVPLAAALASGHPLLASLSPIEAPRDNPLYQLNTAFMADGALIRVSGDVTQPIHLRFVTPGTAALAPSARILVQVDDGSSVTIVESHESEEGTAHQPNHVVEVVAGDRSQIHHVRVNAEGSEVIALSTLVLRLGAEATFRTLNLSIGAALSRHQVFCLCAGRDSFLQINGATMLKGRQHADTSLLVDHAEPGCVSREVFKTVVDGEATGVFQGKIIVQPLAQKTDGRMMSAALLLSDGAAMNNKPELEIFADDVQCAHGATSGALDEDLLFYIMARGIPRAVAESLLVQAFLGEAIEIVPQDDLRETLMGVVERWLHDRH